MDQPRGSKKGSRLPDLTKRTILMLKQANPDWGCQRISDMLARGPALPASPGAVARVLHEAGYVLEEVPTHSHPDHVRHFERAKPNQLWQTDLFTFILKRQNRRVYLVAFMDDHSRFIVGYGLHASQSTALVLEVLRAALTSHGTPEEILTDNGSQYKTWRGKSLFTKELEKRGIKQIVARPRHPQTLGKIERFWGTLWRECLQAAVFVDMGDAQRRIGLFIDHYNFQRCHNGIEGLVPADRFYGAAPEVRKTLQARVAANALELARHGRPTNPFYLTGQVGGQPFSVHAEGERVILTGTQGRQEVDLVPPSPPVTQPELPEPVCPAGVVTQTSEVSETSEVCDPDELRLAHRPWTTVCGRSRRPSSARQEVTYEHHHSLDPSLGQRYTGTEQARQERQRQSLQATVAWSAGDPYSGGQAAGGGHPGSAGRCPDADRCGSSVGHVAAALLLAGGQGTGRTAPCLRETAARATYGLSPPLSDSRARV